MVIGVDFDNTLVEYHALAHELAVARQLIPAHTKPDKTVVRDAIRSHPGGDALWQEVQAALYGVAISRAPMALGAKEFLTACRTHGVTVRIISHKTRTPSNGDSQINLHRSALNWMAEHGVFDSAGPGLSESDVFFEATRADKIDRIQRIQCRAFIDDLAELFLEPAFPDNVRKFLYEPAGRGTQVADVTVFSDWSTLADTLLPS